MTEQEIVQLVQNTPAEQLTLAEVESLRDQLIESEELRVLLIDELQMEEYLTEALGRIDLTVEDVIPIVVEDPTDARTNSLWPLLAIAGSGLLLVAMIAVMVNIASPDMKQEPVAKQDEKQPDTDSTAKAEDGTDTNPKTAADNSGTSQDPKPDDPPNGDPNSTPMETDPNPPMPPVDPNNLPPWHDVIVAEDEPPAFADICFDDFDTSSSLPTIEELRKWFAPVAGHGHKFTLTKSRFGQTATLDGLVRLQSPWRDDTALRLSLENYDKLRIHFFNGLQGLTLAHYQSEGFRWTAYTTDRAAAAPRPKQLALTATDAGRNQRTGIRNGGPLELRHRGGEIILSRGDIVLLRAPMPETPAEAYFDGRAQFFGIALVRTKDFPNAPNPRTVTAEFENPAELSWSEQRARGTKFEKLPDGAVRLSADNAGDRGWVATRFPQGGIQEVILQIEDATPGTGIFLGRGGGRPIEILRFVNNTREKTVGLTLRGDDDVKDVDLGMVADRTVPVAGKRQWIRLLFGCGSIRWWMSSDGVHWAEPALPLINAPGDVTHVGLHHVAKAPALQITLRRVVWRRLAGLLSLADEELVEQAPLQNEALDLGQWLAAVTQLQPEKVDLTAWRRACAVRALAAGCSRDVGQALIELLLDEAASRGLPPNKQLAMLQEAALLIPVHDQPARLSQLVTRYHDIGLSAFDSNGNRPFSFVRRALMTSPLHTLQNFFIANPATIRVELIQLLHRQAWPETLAFCRRLRFYQQNQSSPLVEWAEAVARRRLSRSSGSNSVAKRRAAWQHPLAEELSKEAYNLVAELQALLDSEAYDDASRMLTSMNPNSFSGVAPWAKDQQLLVSMPVAVRLAARQHPPLRDAINESFGPLAQLRVRQGIAAGDAAAVRLAAAQFESTPAAAEAHRWLGDRALSTGWFRRALTEYHRAGKTATISMRAELAPRARLAAAMMGREAGNTVTSDVVFGELKMSASEFEALVKEMVQRNGDGAEPMAVDAAAVQIPQPTAFTAHVRSPLDGALGQSPATEVTPHVRRYSVPWADRQLATVREGDALYVSNRFQVAAYDLTNGSRKWQSKPPKGNAMRSQDWALTPMRPLLTHRYLIARQLYGTTPLLVCLDKTSGQTVWEAALPTNESLITDPLLLQDQLVGLTLYRTDQNESVLRLTTFAQDSGEVLWQRELLRMRESWWLRRDCRAAVLGDSLVAALGGMVVSCDGSGELRWIRKQILLPPDEESDWVQQYFDRPLLHEGDLFVTQPGVRSIECLDPDTGASKWSRVMPSIQRLVGIAGARVIVGTAEGMVALDRKTGKTIWTHAASDMLHPLLCGRDAVLYTQRVPSDQPQKFRPRLVWLDAATGKTRATSELPGLDDADPRLGPLVVHKDRLRTFFGKGQNEPKRDLVELVPAGAAQLVAGQQLPDIWTRHVTPALHQAAAAVMPGWTLLNGQADATTGLLKEANGESNVLSVNSPANSPVIFARQITVPEKGNPRLRLRIGHPQGTNWRVRIDAGRKTLWDRDLDAKFDKQPWKDLDVDLSAIKGQTVWLTVRGRNTNLAQPITTFWKRLEVVP